MREQVYDSEALLQDLLARYPHLLVGEQIDPAQPRRWLLIAREASLPDEEGGSGRWAVDHLFLDQDAVPTLVEVKRSSDTRIRREVVGQMRAYAPELPTGWLVVEVSDAIIAQARAMGLTQLCPRANTVTPELVRRLHAEGFVARAWGVTTEELMQQVVQAGADGMTGNFPDKLIAYLKSHTYQWE